MQTLTEGLGDLILEPFAVKKCLKCKGKRKLSGVGYKPGTLVLYILCETCNETRKVGLEVKWIEDVR